MSHPARAGSGPPEDLAADYQALRGGVGATAIGRDVVAVDGPDALAYLQGQCSQDLAALGVGDSTHSLLLAPDGKVVALVRVLRTADDRFLLDTDGGFGPAVVERLHRFRLRTKVDIEPLDWTCTALRGAGVGGPPTDLPGTDPAPVCLPSEWNGWVGFDVLHPRQAAAWRPRGARWISAAAWEACRVESGVPVMGRELDERTIPAEVPGLVERSVSFTKGCYTGQELVARLDSRGSRVARHLRALVLRAVVDPAELAGAVLVAGGERSVGSVTSAAWSPAAGGVAALAYVHRSVEVGESVRARLGTQPAPIDCEVRQIPLA